MVLKRTLPSRVSQAQVPVSASASASSEAALPEVAIPLSVAEPVPDSSVGVADGQGAGEAPLANDDAPIDVSRPDAAAGGLKRKRVVRKRDFGEVSAQASPESAAVPPSSPDNSAIPQTNVDFDKVMDRLSTLGVVESKKDTLTAKAAPGSAVTEGHLEPIATVVPALPSLPEGPSSTSKEEKPDWLAELQKELDAVSPKKDDRESARREALRLPPPPTLPPNLLSGLVEDLPPSVKTPAPDLPASSKKSAAPAKSETVSSTSQSDVPWAKTNTSSDEWKLDVSGAPSTDETLPPGPVPPGDIYKDVSAAPPVAGAPPWQRTAPPAELPGPRSGLKNLIGAENGGNGYSRTLATGLILAAVAGCAYWLVMRSDKTQEQLARLTGSLRTTTEKLTPDQGGIDGVSGTGITPERTIAMNDGLLPPPDISNAANKALIDFADIPTTQQNKPIVANANDPIPEDVGLIARFQKAVADKKAEKTGIADGISPQNPTGNPAIEKTIRNEELKKQLDAELAAYRQALVNASHVAEAPRPGDFLGKTPEQQKTYMNASENPPSTESAPTDAGATDDTDVDSEGAPLSPPPTNQAGLPEAQMSEHNPNNLPLLDEPDEQPRVRTLADFDATMFEPESEKVRIPRGIKPRLSLSDFPEMDVLSMVPNKGVIAYRNGTEGVLMIGESVDGWQLVQVSSESAEFRNGQRSFYVSAE